MNNTYWNGNGTHQAFVDQVSSFIPKMGSAPPGSPKLEKFRVVLNAYHQLYNNGRCTEICKLLKVSGKQALSGNAEAIKKIEDGVSASLLAAAKELKLI